MSITENTSNINNNWPYHGSKLIPKEQLTFYTIPEANHHNIGSFKLYQETIDKSFSK